MRPLIVYGAGTYAAPVVELARAADFDVVCIVADHVEHPGQDILGVPVQPARALGSYPPGMSMAVAIGNAAHRLRIQAHLAAQGYDLPALVHPRAFVSPSAHIGDGVLVHQMASIWSEVVLESGTIVSPAATVAHHSTIGRGTLISTNANIGAGVSVGPRTFVGIGACVSTGVKTISSDTVIGAGAVVVRDIQDSGGTYVGVPARRLATA
jgi:sugar O-acyltransferase (sialic acid O-acetyltransferase NeuD family)